MAECKAKINPDCSIVFIAAAVFTTVHQNLLGDTATFIRGNAPTVDKCLWWGTLWSAGC